jgi:hypothetical protein
MATNYMIETYLNKEVQIYPGDTYSKFGVVKDINENGVVFEITRSEAQQYRVGDIVFISYSNNLTFKLPNEA